MLMLAQSSDFWEAMTFLFPYLFVVGLMSILAALGWDAGARTPAEPLMESDSEEAMMHQLHSGSVLKLMILNLFTLGGFSFFWLNRLHGKLPQIRSNDPSPGKAIALSLVPIFDFYWLPFSLSRLVLRINQQRRMRNMEESIISGPLVAMVACLLLTTVLGLSALGMVLKWHSAMPLLAIGLAPMVFCWLFISPISCLVVQKSINSLCNFSVLVDDHEFTPSEQSPGEQIDKIEETIDRNEEVAPIEVDETVDHHVAEQEVESDFQSPLEMSDDIMPVDELDDLSVEETLDFQSDEEK